MSKTGQHCIFPPPRVLETFQEVLKAEASRLQAGQSVQQLTKRLDLIMLPIGVRVTTK